MHRSRLATVIIDCAEADFERGRQFWSAALGKPLLERNERYASLQGRIGGEGALYLGFQRVSERTSARSTSTSRPTTSSRRGGAARAARRAREGAHPRHVVMEAPSGHAFCVIPARPRRLARARYRVAL